MNDNTNLVYRITKDDINVSQESFEKEIRGSFTEYNKNSNTIVRPHNLTPGYDGPIFIRRGIIECNGHRRRTYEFLSPGSLVCIDENHACIEQTNKSKMAKLQVDYTSECTDIYIDGRKACELLEELRKKTDFIWIENSSRVLKHK